jgi:hypothetical protein
MLAACGKSATGSSSTSSSPSASTSTSAAAAATPATLVQLQRIVLQAADLPSGWKGAPYQADTNDDAVNVAFMKCLGMRNTDPDRVAEAHSDDFNLGNATISSSATSYKSQSDLDSDVASMHSPKISTCFKQLVKTQLASSMPAGSSIKSASISIMPGSDGGPSNVIATGTGHMEIEVSGQEVPVYMNFSFITGPLTEAEVDAENVGTPISPSVLNPLIATVATRAKG